MQSAAILSDLARGDAHAAGRLLPLVYDELRKLAAARMAEQAPGNTLDPTALVHGAYLRLVGPANAVRWDIRGDFFAAAAEVTRRTLVEAAQPAAPDPRSDLVALGAALSKLATVDPQASKLVELRDFTGFSGAEAAQALGISPARKRFLREARSFAKVRHESVVQVHAVEEQPLPYLVMELIPGEIRKTAGRSRSPPRSAQHGRTAGGRPGHTGVAFLMGEATPRSGLSAENVNTLCSLRELLSGDRIAVTRYRHGRGKLERLSPRPDARDGGADARWRFRPPAR
jgi:serine/threonine protein kinase